MLTVHLKTMTFLDELRNVAPQLNESQTVSVAEERAILSALIYMLDNRLRMLEALVNTPVHYEQP